MNGQLNMLRLPTARRMQIGGPPKQLNKTHQQAWHDIVDKCEKYELLRCDRIFLEIVVDMLVEYRTRAVSAARVSALNSGLLKMGVPLKSRKVLLANREFAGIASEAAASQRVRSNPVF